MCLACCHSQSSAMASALAGRATVSPVNPSCAWHGWLCMEVITQTTGHLFKRTRRGMNLPVILCRDPAEITPHTSAMQNCRCAREQHPIRRRPPSCCTRVLQSPKAELVPLACLCPCAPVSDPCIGVTSRLMRMRTTRWHAAGRTCVSHARLAAATAAAVYTCDA